MTRILIMSALICLSFATRSWAETYNDSGLIRGLLTGAFTVTDGTTGEITTYDYNDAPMIANFSFEYDTDSLETGNTVFYVTGDPPPVFFGGTKTSSDGASAIIVDSTPGSGPDQLSVSFTELVSGPIASDGSFFYEILDPSGSFFETGSLSGVTFTASGQKTGMLGDGSGDAYRFSFTFRAVPEPSSLALCVIALTGLCVAARRRGR